MAATTLGTNKYGIYKTNGAAESAFFLDATTTDSTLNGTGVVDLNIESATTNNRGIDLAYTVTGGSGITNYGIYNAFTDAQAQADTNFAQATILSNTGANTSGSKKVYGSYLSTSATGANVAAETDAYGVYSTATATQIHASGGAYSYGGYFTASGKTTGRAGAYGIWATASRATTSVAAVLAGPVRMDVNAGSSTEGVCRSGTDAAVDKVEIYDCSGTPASDYAEMYATEPDVEYEEVVVTGTRVVQVAALDSEGNVAEDGSTVPDLELVKSQQPYQDNVIGITSNNYGDFSSIGHNRINENDHPLPVALSGRVPVKVTDEGGPIQPGDLLTTPSTPGHAMRADPKRGTTFAKALSSFSGPGSGVVTAFIQLDNRPNLQTAFADIDLEAQTFATTAGTFTVDALGN